MWVITHFGSALMPVKCFDGGVAVQYPWGVQCVFHTIQQGLAHPLIGKLNSGLLLCTLLLIVVCFEGRCNVSQSAA